MISPCPAGVFQKSGGSSKIIHDFFPRFGYNVPQYLSTSSWEVLRLRKLNAAIDRFAYSHPRFGIPNLMKVLVAAMAVVFVLDLFSNGYATYMLYFNAPLILQGELWRLVTWMFLPTNGSLFWIFISLSFYYFIGTSIEEYWGTAKFTLFYLASALLMVVFGMVSLLWDPSPSVSSWNLNQILFLAFATLYPDALIRIYLILPVKAKWLAVLYVVLTVYDLLRSGLWGALFTLPQLLAVWLVYLVFFWDRIADLLGEFGFAVRHQNSSQTIHFKAAVKQQRKKAREQGYRHRCEVCGRTDTDFPDLQFRYCSKCAGYHCFCQDHIFNHTHFTE